MTPWVFIFGVLIVLIAANALVFALRRYVLADGAADEGAPTPDDQSQNAIEDAATASARSDQAKDQNIQFSGQAAFDGAKRVVDVLAAPSSGEAAEPQQTSSMFAALRSEALAPFTLPGPFSEPPQSPPHPFGLDIRVTPDAKGGGATLTVSGPRIGHMVWRFETLDEATEQGSVVAGTHDPSLVSGKVVVFRRAGSAG